MDYPTTSVTQRDGTYTGLNALAGGWWGIEKRDVGDKGRAVCKEGPVVKSSQFHGECSCLLQLLFLTQPFNLSDSDNQGLFYSIWLQLPKCLGSKRPHFVWVILQTVSNFCFIYCLWFDPNDHFLSIHCVQSSKKTARILCKPCLCVFSWSLSRELHPTHIPSSTLGSLVGGSPSAHLTECTCLLPLQLPMCKCPLTPPMPRVEGWVSGQLISTLVLWLFFSPPLKGRHTPFP